jgi:hypothetical protein
MTTTPTEATGQPRPSSPKRTRTTGPGAVVELPLHRLHLMRVGYLVMGLGLAVVKWPVVVSHDRSWPLMEGVVACLLTAMSLLAFLGLRYPVRLLPILLFESLWKIIWLSVVALPKVAAGDMDPATQDVAFNCLFVVIILAVVPWRYVWQHYATAKGDRWRGPASGGHLEVPGEEQSGASDYVQTPRPQA